MESSMYSQDGSVSLYFVRPSMPSEEATPTLLCAYQACEENNLNPEWMTTCDCVTLAPNKQDVFVIDPFEGDAFKHLCSGFKCVVLGPQCILSCLHRKESIPELPSPIYNTAMKGLVLSSTGFVKEERADLQWLVERMAGIYSNNYHQGVTHMVANSVGSKKYLVAVEEEIPILTGEWVRAVWKAATGQEMGEDIRATDGRFLSFGCPVFKGLTICVSQLDRKTKNALKTIIVDNGGTYSMTLDMHTTSVLIIPTPEGEKYNHAVNWRVQCLTPDWINDSVEQGFALKMNGYMVSKRGTSTPTLDTTSNVPMPDFSMCSTISNDTGMHKLTHIDESTLDMSMAKRRETDASEVSRGLESLESLNLPEAMRAGLFLDGCKIFLSGFSAAHVEKLRRVLNAGGATRFNQLSEAVSHVVLGKRVEEHLTTIQGWNSRPHIVYADWITESIKQKRPADEGPYALQLDTENFKSPMAMNIRAPRRISNNTTFGNNETHVDEEVLNQYLKHQNPNLNGSTDANDSLNTLPNSQAGDMVQMFEGKVFKMCGYSQENLKNLVRVIEEHGGEVMFGNHKGPVHYALTCTAERTCLDAQDMVSHYFLEDCTEQEKLLPVDYYHLPLQLPGEVFPLVDCTVTISSYCGKERIFLETITTLLGAMYQEVFAKKSNPGKDIRGSTHLICPETSEGGKYRAAVKWGVPTVTADWLLECARTGTRVPEEVFSVTASAPPSLDKRSILRELYEKTVNSNDKDDDTIPFDETEDMEVPATPINKVIIALKNQSFCSPSEIKTPSPETFRKMYPTPGTSVNAEDDSLSEMKTPETPYGSTWYGANPPPRIRKRFKRMLDAIPDPPQPRKPPGTPIEDMFKKFISDGQEFLKNHKTRKTPVFLRKDKKTEQEEEEELGEKDETIAADCHGAPFTGVVVCISRKLQDQQWKLQKAVTALGGEFCWTYDSSVTHYIFQGKKNDLSKDFRQAQDDGKIIVAPDWVWMCQDENSRIDEVLFPHTHKPKMTLSLVGGKSSPVKRKNRFKRKNPDDHMDVEKERKDVQSSGSGQENREGKDKNDEEEERAKISKQLEEIDALASNNVSSGRKSVGGGRSLALTDRMRYTLTMTMPLETQPVSSEIPDSQSTGITWEDPQELEARRSLQNQLTKDTQDIISDNHQLLSRKEKKENEAEENVSAADQTATEERGEKSSTAFVFMLLGMNEERVHYVKLVEELGGKVSHTDHFDPSATHVVTPKPSRSERNLGSIASGKWLLHDSYLVESSRRGCFVEEESFAWGNPESSILPKLKPETIEAQLSAAAWRWRRLIHSPAGSRGDGVTVQGAFQSMKALIHTSPERVGAFSRLIQAGGGKVIKARPPFSDVEGVTHFFLELNKTSDKVDLACFAARQVPCLSPVYLSNYLIQDMPDEAELYVPEYKEILANMSTSNHSMIKRKRKGTNS